MCTANTTDTIPGPLQDRLELVRIAGYMESEKEVIARQCLAPEALQRLCNGSLLRR